MEEGDCHASRSITVVILKGDAGFHVSSSSCMEGGVSCI